MKTPTCQSVPVSGAPGGVGGLVNEWVFIKESVKTRVEFLATLAGAHNVRTLPGTLIISLPFFREFTANIPDLFRHFLI